MNEKQTTRPTKKQRELLTYIQEFISQHGYSPSYREIMNGLNYTSVATVALHVGNLIKRGHLIKRDRSARSLEVVNSVDSTASPTSQQVSESEEKWLVQKVEHAFKQVEQLEAELQESAFDHLYVLTGALKVLGLQAAANGYVPRLAALKARVDSNEG